MKKQSLPILIALTIASVFFTLGLLVGINLSSGGIQVSVPRSMETVPPQITVSTSPGTEFPVNINTATKEELMTLPGIGEELAQRILDYRQAVILFSAPEELINVEGIGTKLVEEILHLVTIGG